MTVKIFVDGSSSKENECMYCVVKTSDYLTQHKVKPKKNIYPVPGHPNCYEMEFMALIKALESVSSFGPDKPIEIYSDSKQVCDDINGTGLKYPKDLIRFYRAKELMAGKNIKVIKIPREKNLAGFELERLVKQRAKKTKKEKVIYPVILPKEAPTIENSPYLKFPDIARGHKALKINKRG